MSRSVLVLTMIAFFAAGIVLSAIVQSGEVVESVPCARCAQLRDILEKREGELRELRAQPRVEASVIRNSPIAPAVSVAAPVVSPNDELVASAMSLREANEKIRAERDLLLQQLMTLLNERAQGLLERYWQSHPAGESWRGDRLREYLTLAYRLGLNPDLAQLERLDRAVGDLVPRLNSVATAIPEHFDPERPDWQPPQFDLIDWRHEQQLKLARELQEAVANALSAPTTLLFPEEGE